jgi:hypothetical protein
MPAYRQSHRENFIWVGIVLAGLAAGIALTIILSRYSESPWLLAAMMVPFLGGIGAGVWRMKAMKNARKAGIRAMLEREQFAVDLSPGPERAQTVFAPVQHLQSVLDLRDGAARIDWLALHGPSTLIFEHEHVTGSGRSTVVHTCTVIAISAAHAILSRARLGVDPWMWSERPALLRGRYLRSLGNVVTVGDAAFDRDWITFGHAPTARALFTATVRNLLATSPRGEVWCVGHGFVCCAYRGALTADHLARMLQRARDVLSA